MSVSYLLAPIPKWVLVGNDGKTAGGGYIKTFRTLNKTQPKPVYQDPDGIFPYTNPIVFNANGVQGPFYWAVDSANLDDTYFLEAFDANNNPLWTVDDYFPPGSGGGGSVTSYLPLKNLIANNVFIDNTGDTANPIGVTNLVLAPSNHHGFTPDLTPFIGTYGAVGPDIRFVKNNTAATDQISFVPFGAGNDLLIGDVTPINYVRYQCTNNPLGETYKSFQFPVCQGVNNLDSQQMTFTIWAKVTTTPVTINLFLRQFFGSGGSPSAEVRGPSPTGSMALTSSWQPFNIQFTVPTTAMATLGTTGDDAIYLQLDMPLGQECDVQFILTRLLVGSIGTAGVGSTFIDFDTYDEIDQITQSPRTGDIKTSIRSTPMGGWIAMNDGTIGNASSGATTRANIDTFPLYKTIYDCVSNTYAPVSPGGRSGSAGNSASIDFNAGKTLTLTKTLGRALSGAGTATGYASPSTWAVGQYFGTENQALTAANNGPHTHSLGSGAGFFGIVVDAGSAPGLTNVGTALGNITDSSGSGTPFNIIQPTVYYNVFAKL